jgi:hypothetical protein
MAKNTSTPMKPPGDGCRPKVVDDHEPDRDGAKGLYLGAESPGHGPSLGLPAVCVEPPKVGACLRPGRVVRGYLRLTPAATRSRSSGER